MMSIYSVALALYLQLALSFSAIGLASTVKSPTAVTTSGKLVGVDDGVGGMFSLDAFQIR